MNLDGKIALVTAAAQGIGRASALALSKAGAQVIATDLDAGKLASLAAEGLRTEAFDVLEPDAAAKLAERLGRVDILFNCAGVVHAGTILDYAETELDFAFELNVKAMARTIRAFLPGMIERGDGSIVNMASVAGSVTGVPNRFAYGVTKAAVVGLTKSVAKDFVGQGIRCNAVCPGTVETPSLQQRISQQGDYETTRAAFVARQPIGRLGTPEEIADLIVHLAGATYTTGQAYVIDGGWTI